MPADGASRPVFRGGGDFGPGGASRALESLESLGKFHVKICVISLPV